MELTATPMPVAKEGVCPLSTKELVDLIVAFVDVFNEPAGIELYNYQRAFMRRIARSLLIRDGQTVTGLWSRQCLAKGTKVLMYDGTQQAVEKVRVGDLLMGDDSTPRHVLSLARGRDCMVRVVPGSNCHEPYVVNKAHILSLRKHVGGSSYDRPRKKLWEAQDIEAEQLLGKNLDNYRGYKAAVDFPEQEVPLEPYYLGAWLGDGTSRSTAITNIDPEVISYIEEYAGRLGLRVAVYPNKVSSASSYAIVSSHNGTREGRNPVLTALQGLGLLRNKHIPQAYKSNSHQTRLEVLAGIIDTDGSRSTAPGKENTCEVTFVSKRLSDDLQWLCRSLGFRASQAEKVVNGTTYYRVCIYGDLSVIPTRIARKQWPSGVVLKDDPTQYGITLEELPEAEYFGFTLDGNHRFLLGDCTVTHNSGKSECMSSLASGLAIIMPTLARAFPRDPRLITYKQGFWIGIFAPKLKQSTIIYDRIRSRAMRKSSLAIYRDPDINISVTSSRGDQVSWSNGSFVIAQTANEGSNAEGQTFHLVIIDEAQYVNESKVSKEIKPMLAATNGSMVKIGTAHVSYGGFRHDIEYNIEREKNGGERNHFEFPYDMVIAEKRRTFAAGVAAGKENQFHLNYEAWVATELERLGGNIESDEFAMNFRLIWKDANVGAIDRNAFALAADEEIEAGERRRRTRQVAGIDFGKVQDLTVLTIMEVDIDHPITDIRALLRPGDDTPVFYNKTIIGWKEARGKWADQLQEIVETLDNYAVDVLVADATGVGDPLVDMLQSLLPGINVVPFKFSAGGNDKVFKLYIQELESGRLRYAAGPETQKTAEYSQFVIQHKALGKEYNGAYLVCSAPEGEHDDYPDSAALACWATNFVDTDQVETSVNPRYARGNSPGASTSRADRYRNRRR